MGNAQSCTSRRRGCGKGGWGWDCPLPGSHLVPLAPCSVPHLFLMQGLFFLFEKGLEKPMQTVPCASYCGIRSRLGRKPQTQPGTTLSPSPSSSPCLVLAWVQDRHSVTWEGIKMPLTHPVLQMRKQRPRVTDSDGSWAEPGIPAPAWGSRRSHHPGGSQAQGCYRGTLPSGLEAAVLAPASDLENTTRCCCQPQGPGPSAAWEPALCITRT